MAIIADNVYGRPENVIMADDGKGKGIKIPSFLISKDDGRKIKDTIHRIEQREQNRNIPGKGTHRLP